MTRKTFKIIKEVAEKLAGRSLGNEITKTEFNRYAYPLEDYPESINHVAPCEEENEYVIHTDTGNLIRYTVFVDPQLNKAVVILQVYDENGKLLLNDSLTTGDATQSDLGYLKLLAHEHNVHSTLDFAPYTTTV